MVGLFKKLEFVAIALDLDDKSFVVYIVFIINSDLISFILISKNSFIESR